MSWGRRHLAILAGPEINALYWSTCTSGFVKKYIITALILALSPVASTKVSAIAWPDPTASHLAAVVSIHSNSPAKLRNMFCTGTLVADRWVLTAAHCLEKTNVKSLVISVNFGTKNQLDYKVLKYFIPSKASLDGSWLTANNGYDISLLKLATQVTNVKPIRITSIKNIRKFAGKVTLYGFGLNESEHLLGSMGARDVVFLPERPVYDLFPESANPRNIAALASRQYETSECYPDSTEPLTCQRMLIKSIDGAACAGDSGGPIIGNLEGNLHILAIVSYGTDCIEPVPSIYVKMNSFAQWAKTIILSN